MPETSAESWRCSCEGTIVTMIVLLPTSADNYIAALKAGVAACGEHQCSRLLMDFRSSSGVLTFIDRYRFASEGAMLVGSNIQVAVVLRPDQMDPEQFGKRVAVNRGVSVELFHDESAATAWLAGQKVDGN